MRQVFADTLYWVATIAPGDPWHEPATRAAAALGSDLRIVTTEEVPTEVLSAYSGQGAFLRGRAVAVVEAVLANANTTVLEQSTDSFHAGLALYSARPDKGYSLVDCVSMSAMRALGITEILTNDHHFAQEGFQVLVRK